MTANWFFYALLIGGLLTLAAWQAGKAASGAGGGSRWPWFFAGLFTVILPLKAWRYPVSETTRVLPIGPEWSWPAPALPPSADHTVVTGLEEEAARFRPSESAAPLWVAASALTLLWLAASHLRLARSRRLWRRELVQGIPVLQSEDFGPAVVGLLRPEVVLPRWVLQLPAEEIELVLKHELEHVKELDSRLLGLMSLLLVIMPWQPFLWLQLAGLRLGIELDCDRRVVPFGTPVRSYGELLLSLASRGSHRRLYSWALPLATFWPARSSLERRIRELTARRSLRTTLLAAAGALATSLVACGAHAPAPAAPDQVMTATRDSVAVDGLAAQADHEMRPVLEANFTAPVIKTLPDSMRIYWVVTELNGDVVRTGEGGREIVWWSPTAYRERWPREYQAAKAQAKLEGKPFNGFRRGVFVLTNQEIFKRFPDLDHRSLNSYGLSPMVFGADSVMLVWGKLNPPGMN